MWEYLHRVLGRLIFIYVLIPGLLLWRKKIVSGKLVFLLAALVAVQGLIGWLMVKTGLNVKPHVSPYMLALHFFAAIGLLLYGYRNFLANTKMITLHVQKPERKLLHTFGILLAIQIFYGCLTSGLKAGIGYNTFPLMNGEFFPNGGLFFSPLIVNFFENPATVQWTHRWLGILVLLSLLRLLVYFSKAAHWAEFKPSLLHLFAIVCTQVLLGILNIIYVVPVPLAAIHQLIATLLIVSYFRIIFLLPPEKEGF